jgi:hypothetical protein
MADIFWNIDPPTPLTVQQVCPPLTPNRGRTQLQGGEGGGGLEKDARHRSVLYVCKYFVILKSFFVK